MHRIDSFSAKHLRARTPSNGLRLSPNAAYTIFAYKSSDDPRMPCLRMDTGLRQIPNMGYNGSSFLLFSPSRCHSQKARCRKLTFVSCRNQMKLIHRAVYERILLLLICIYSVRPCPCCLCLVPSFGIDLCGLTIKQELHVLTCKGQHTRAAFVGERNRR